jgi:TolA-binding protein
MASSEYEKALETKDYGFWDPYTQPPLAGNAAKLVDSALERCGKLLVLHSKSRWVDDALLMMGNCFVLKGENQSAIRKYDEIIEIYSNSELVPEARYMKAYTLVRDGSDQQAAAILTDLLQKSERKRLRERSAFLLARIAHEADDCEQAVTRFEDYLEDFPEGRKVIDVRLNMASCLLQLDRAEDVIKVLEPLGEVTGPAGVEATLRTGRAYREMGENQKAIDTFRDLVEAAPAESTAARVKMEIAETLTAMDLPQEAILAFDDADRLAGKTHSLKDEAAYRKGLVYERHIRDFDKAIATYDEAAQSPTGFGVLARDRASALKDVKRYSEALTDSIPDPAEEEARHRFMLGETYSEDLGLRNEAIEQFRIVADSLPDTKFGPPAMLRTASILREQGDNEADAYYLRVIETYPGTVYANLARHSMDLPLVDVEIPEPDTVPVPDSALEVGPQPVETAGADSLARRIPEIVGPPAPEEAPGEAVEPLRQVSRVPGVRDTVPPEPVDTSQVAPPGPPKPEVPDAGAASGKPDSVWTETTQDTTGQEERPDQ